MHGTNTYYSYTSHYNLLNHSSGVVPHSHVLPTDAYPAGYKPTNEEEKGIWEKWSAKGWEGAPVCVQVVCGRYEEEKALETMKVVDAAIRG